MAAGGLTKTGAGLLSLTGASSYTGGTTVDAGTLRLGSGGFLSPTGALIVNGGNFDLENGIGQTVGSLAGTGGAVTLGDGSLTVDQSATTSFAGSIGGAGGLTKTGAGQLSLTGASSYTGDTTVDAGTLQLGSGGSLASTTALIVNGGSFDHRERQRPDRRLAFRHRRRRHPGRRQPDREPGRDHELRRQPSAARAA